MFHEDDQLETEYLGNKTCPDNYPHFSHDWFVFNGLEGKVGKYRCYGSAIPEPEVKEVTISDMARLWGPEAL